MNEVKLRRGIATDSILLTIVRFVSMAVSILITMLLSNKFSLNDYGTYSQANLVISIGTSLTILGLTDGANFFYNSTNEVADKRDYISTIFLIQLVVGIVGAFCILIFQQHITNYFNNSNLKYLYTYIAFSPLLSNILSIYQVLFISIGKAKIIAFRSMYVSVTRFTVVAVACLITERVVTIFVLLLLVDILQLSYFCFSFYKNAFCISFNSVRLKLVRPILKYCIPLAVYILTNTLTRDMDKMVIGRLNDTETLALYANCAKVLPFDILTISFATVLIPYITRFVTCGQHDKSQHLYSNYLCFSYTTTWILAFGAIITAPELIRFLYSEKYLPGLTIFIIYIIVDMIRFANVSIILRAKGKSRALMLYSLSSLVANLVLNIILYNLFGIIGPAIATLLVTFTVNMLMLVQGAKVLETSLFNLINYRDVSVLTFELIIIGGISYGIRYLLNSYGINSNIVLFVSYGFYIIFMGIMNFSKVLSLLKEMNKIRI